MITTINTINKQGCERCGDKDGIIEKWVRQGSPDIYMCRSCAGLELHDSIRGAYLYMRAAEISGIKISSNRGRLAALVVAIDKLEKEEFPALGDIRDMELLIQAGSGPLIRAFNERRQTRRS